MDFPWLIKHLLISSLVLLLFIAVIPIVFQDMLVCPAALNNYFHGPPSLDGKPPEAVRYTIPSTDNVALDIWTREVVAPGKRPILFLHGNGTTAVGMSGFLEIFARWGRNSYILDYRGFGHSTGWPTEKGLYSDCEAALAWVAERNKIAVEDVVLIGESLGSGFASYIAAKHDSRFLILTAPYTTLPDAAALHPFGIYARFLWWSVPQIEYISRLRRTSVIALHGIQDGTIPAAHSSILKARYHGSGSYELRLEPNVGHGVTYPFIEWIGERLDRLESEDPEIDHTS